MPLFKIERPFKATDDDDALEAAALRALACAYWFQDLRWIRSFVDRDRDHVTCLYEAASEADIREHARIANIPCDDIREVHEIGPELFQGRSAEGAAPPQAPLAPPPAP